MEEKGTDLLGDAAEHLVINSQLFVGVLLPGDHSIIALTRLISSRTCTNLHCPLLHLSVLPSPCTHSPEHGASGGT